MASIYIYIPEKTNIVFFISGGWLRCHSRVYSNKFGATLVENQMERFGPIGTFLEKNGAASKYLGSATVVEEFVTVLNKAFAILSVDSDADR